MAYSGISYQGGATGVTIKTFRGFFDGGLMRALSTSPVVLMPAALFTTIKYVQLLGFSIYGGYATTGLTLPAQLTWDLPLAPFAEFSWQTQGANLVSLCLHPPTSSTAIDYFFENNINGGVTAPLVLKSTVNSPAADFDQLIYEVFYIESDILTI